MYLELIHKEVRFWRKKETPNYIKSFKNIFQVNPAIESNTGHINVYFRYPYMNGK